MSSAAFEKACDRLSRELDPSGHEHRRWAKDEGAKIVKVAELMTQLFEGKDGLKLEPQSQTRDARCFVLTVGSDKVAQLTAKLSENSINIWAVEVAGGSATVSSHGPGVVPLATVTPESVADAVAAALDRISA